MSVLGGFASIAATVIANAAGGGAGEGGGPPNQDNGIFPEQNVTLPWTVDPRRSWLDYRCWIESYLDAGIALHKPLPQTNPSQGRALGSGSFRSIGVGAVLNSTGVDTLASGQIMDRDLDKNINGVNLQSISDFTDVLQRMATSTYRFAVKGYGVRLGYQIPIPGTVSVAGVQATPAERQFATSAVVGNLSGVPVWFARWELWYYVNLPPERAQVPPPNLAQHIRGDAQLPKDLRVPQSQPDQNATAGRVPSPQRQEGRIR